MKINEVEAAVGVTKKNIRFYEEEGLISPRREPGNGYRSYSEADVERLRRIKLLRKLDVPLAEIRQMLEGECTLAEGMSRQLERLNTRRTDLDEAVNFCTLLQREPVSLNELDVEQTLARLTAKEEQGVTFVDIEQVDRKAERIRGALVGAGLFTAIMLLSIGIMAWAFCVDPQDVPPLPLLVVLFGIPAGCIIGTLKWIVSKRSEREKKMLIVTINEVPGKKIEALGVVRGSTVQSRNLGHDIMAGFRTLVGGEVTDYAEMLTEARQIATGRMAKNAEELGADAVVGMRYASASVMQGAAEVIAYGTAVRFV